MSSLPIAPMAPGGARSLPDYLPARMVNEFVYCPRLFHLEHVLGEFAHNAETLEGKHLHRVVDAGKGELPAAPDLEEDFKTRSVTLSSERLRVIAKMDLVDVRDGVVTPVDTKRGRPMEEANGLGMWPADRVQLALQMLILRDNGYRCEEGFLFYAETKQRVKLLLSDAVIQETENAVSSAWLAASATTVPPPLEDSPKCPRCSLVGICLPDEGALLAEEWDLAEAEQLPLFDVLGAPPKKSVRRETRRLLAAREERKPLYLNTQGLRVGKSSGVLQMREKDKLLQEVRLHEICQMNLLGNVQVSTQAMQALFEAEIPVCYFSQGGWFYGMATGLSEKNVFLRQAQYKLAEEGWFARRLAGALVAGKIRNQRTMLLRNHEEPETVVLEGMREMAERAEEGPALDQLLGIEGNAARLYFGSFSGLLKVDGDIEFGFQFETRNRRPPRDPVNALLSLGYSMLTKDVSIACHAVGFDPMGGFYHRPRHGRPALALDLMEPFRPLIVDSAVISAINTKMVQPGHFVRAGEAVALTAEGRKAFYRAYELRMDSLVTHPQFGYRLSYRRLLEVQVRILGKLVQGEIGKYPAFVTR